MRAWLLVPATFLLALVGCPDNDEIPGPPTDLPSSGTGGAGPSVTTGSVGGMGGTGGTGGSMGVGASGGEGGSGGAGGTGGGGGQGGADAMVNGCTMAEADDMTNMGAVTISDWNQNHQRCIRVSANTTITWQTSSSFTSHPIVGGERPTSDATSPITLAAVGVNGTGATSLDVTFATAGTYPYFCDVHNNMNGAIYVE